MENQFGRELGEHERAGIQDLHPCCFLSLPKFSVQSTWLQYKHEALPCPGAGTAPSPPVECWSWDAPSLEFLLTPSLEFLPTPSLEFLLTSSCSTWLNERPDSISQPILTIPPWMFLLLKSLLVVLDQSCPEDPQDHVLSIQGCSRHRFSMGKPSCRLFFAVCGTKQVTVLYCILWGNTWGCSRVAAEIPENLGAQPDASLGHAIFHIFYR